MNTYRNIFSVLVLMMICAGTALAQTEHQHEKSDKTTLIQPQKKGQKYLDQEMLKMDMAGKKKEPHHVMAMAYLQNIGTFAKALRDQAQESNQLSSDFARAIVNEISRSLDKADDHHQEHMKTMDADMRSKMAAMMKDMELRRSKLKDAVKALEKDVSNYTLDAKLIAADSAEILKQLDDMSKMHSGN